MSESMALATDQSNARGQAQRATPRQWLSQRRDDATFAPRWWWAASALALTVAVHIYVAWERLGPALAADEVSTVGAAQVIARGGTDWVLAGSGYMPGTALLVAPAWWFSDDPFVVYTYGLAVGVVLSLIALWPLSIIAREAGVRSTTGAVTIAAVVLLAPARTVPLNYVVSESALLLATATLFAVAFRARRSPNTWMFALTGVTAGLVFLAHGRGIAVTAGAATWVLVTQWGRWRNLTVFAVSTVASVGLSWLLFRWVAGELYWKDDRLNQTFDGWARHTFGEVVGTAFGLGWYVMAAWPAIGLVGIGLAVWRTKRLGNVSLLIFTLVPTIALALVQLDKAEPFAVLQRLDAWIYGRYADHLFTIAAVVGLAILVRVRSRLVTATLVASSALIGIGFLLVTAPQIRPGGAWAHLHVGGVVYMLSEANYLTNQPEPWLLLTAAAWLISALVVVAAYRRAAPLVLALMFTALSLASDAGIVDPHDEPKRISHDIAKPLAEVPTSEPVAFDLNYGLGINAFAFALHPRQVVPVEMDEAAADYFAVYAPYGATDAHDYGALPYDSPSYYNFWLWIFPGPVFDDLNEQGRLVPAPTTEDSTD